MRVSFQWGSKQSMLIWVVVVSVLSDGVNGKANATETSVETERKLKLLNKPAVESIQVCIVHPS